MTEIPQATNLKTLMEILEDEFTKNKTIEGNVARLTKILEAYKSHAQDWKEYALFDPSKYTRNLVDDGNGRYNLIIECRSPGQESLIQDHNIGHCIFKVLHGELTEFVYELPAKSLTLSQSSTQSFNAASTPTTASPPFPTPEHAMILKRQGLLVTHSVTHINNKIGAQKISNKGTVPAVSIHLYSPPVLECNIYSPSTGRAKPSGKLPLHSKYGELIHPTGRRFKISNSFQISNDYYSAAAGQNVPPVLGKTVKIMRPVTESTPSS